MKHAFTLLIVIGCLLTLAVFSVVGGPVFLKTDPKPPNCPHGKCFIDRCARICSCFPPEGNTTCTNIFKTSTCADNKSTDNCPLGKTYKSPHWTNNFLCYCNNHTSQTYECFDISLKQPAKAQDLLVRNIPTTYEVSTKPMQENDKI